jgi:transposase
MDGLAALVKEQLSTDPFSGAVYVFRAKRADRVKLIWWDGSGLCFFAKLLEEGPFPLAQDRGRFDAADAGPDSGAGRRARLAARSYGPSNPGAGGRELTATG